MEIPIFAGGMWVKVPPGAQLPVAQVASWMATTNGTPMQIRRAWLNLAASQTATEIVPAVAHAAIRVIALNMLTGSTATQITFNSTDSTPTTTAISPDYTLAANGGMVLPYFPGGWLQTLAINTSLTVTSGAGSTTGILVSFVEIPEDEFNLL